jgi:hypothetical protein
MKEMVILVIGMALLHHVKNLVVVVVSSVTTGDVTEGEEKMRMVGELLQVTALISGVSCKLQHVTLPVGQPLLQLP